MRRRAKLTALILAAAAASVPLTVAMANHVRIKGTSETVTVAPGVVTVTPGAVVRTVDAVPASLQADDIEAHQVRAQTIYANRIEADQIQGMIHQSGEVKIKDTQGDIEAPDVAALVIYADKIKANSVVADNIFVRDLHRR